MSESSTVPARPRTPQAWPVARADEIPPGERFLGSILVSQADPQLAAREIDRLCGHPRMVQVLMGSGAQFPMGHRWYTPIYEAAARNNLPVAIHPGNEGTGVAGPSTPAGYPGSYLEWHTNLASNYIAHLVSLLVEGTLVRFPNLRVIMLEEGVSWLPPILWRLDKNWKALPADGAVGDPAPERVRPRAHRAQHAADRGARRPQPFPGHLGMFDAARMLVFSSDYPHWDGDTPDFAARAFPQEMRNRIMSETARELFNLPPAPVPQPDGTDRAAHTASG